MTQSLSNEQNRAWHDLQGEIGNYYLRADVEEQRVFRDWLRELLTERRVTVDFVKANGEFRSMECTLAQSLGAKYTVNENKESQKKPNDNVCVVWDINQSAWRSFRWDRIKKVTFEIG